MAQTYGDRWQIIDELGKGGQGFTYLVKDLRGTGDTPYVLKRLINRRRRERFKREIETIRNLAHEHIVQLIDFDIDAEKPYLVMEHCAGGDLDHADPFWRQTPAASLKLFLQICDGVRYAHAQNIIHRDIKPANIFLRTPTGPAVIGDFGICYVDDDGTRLTLTDEAVGPRLFIAPELEDGRLDRISDKSDIYSLGKLLYWLLTGEIFSREQHRDPKWDLKGYNEDTLLRLGWDNIYMEHVNRLLDLMIVAEPEKRRGISNIITLTRDTLRLVTKEYNPIDPHIPQLCTYCGHGVYISQPHDNVGVTNFGFSRVSGSDWRILVCNQCGHVQRFRVDMAHRKDWWQE